MATPLKKGMHATEINGNVLLKWRYIMALSLKSIVLKGTIIAILVSPAMSFAVTAPIHQHPQDHVPAWMKALQQLNPGLNQAQLAAKKKIWQLQCEKEYREHVQMPPLNI